MALGSSKVAYTSFHDFSVAVYKRISRSRLLNLSFMHPYCVLTPGIHFGNYSLRALNGIKLDLVVWLDIYALFVWHPQEL